LESCKEEGRGGEKGRGQGTKNKEKGKGKQVRKWYVLFA